MTTLEVAVIGVPDDKWGEALKAIVVLKKGEEATEEEIIDFCGERLSAEVRYHWVLSEEYWREYYENFIRMTKKSKSKHRLSALNVIIPG